MSIKGWCLVKLKHNAIPGLVLLDCNIVVQYQEYYYNKEGGRVSYSSIVPCIAVVRAQARLMIFTMCGVVYGVIVGSRIRIVTQCACQVV